MSSLQGTEFVSVPETPVKWDLLIKKNIVQASFWAVLCHYGNIRHLDTPADELAQVGVIELPEDGQRDSEPYLTYEGDEIR